MHLLLDTGHLALTGDDYVPVMQGWWSRIGHIHVKDMRTWVLQDLSRDTATFDDGVGAGMFTVS